MGRVVAGESVRSFLKNNDFEMSAALAAYGFFALIPLFFLLAHLFGNSVFSSDMVLRAIGNLLGHLFPTMDQFIIKEFSFITKHRVSWGAATSVFIFVSIMSLVDTMKTAFSKIFNAHSELPFVKSQLANIRHALIMLLLVFSLLTAEIGYSLLSARLFAARSVFIAVSILVATACMMVFYRTFLSRSFGWGRLLSASVVSAVLIIFMREIFLAFLASAPGYGGTYGSLKTLFILIIWVYYCFLVILFGAEIMANFMKKDALLLKGFFTTGSSTGTPGVLVRRFVQRYEQGEAVFHEGAKGENMFYVVNGAVQIRKNDQVIRTLERGEYAGEMSMLLNSPRTATVIATEPDTELIHISQDNFDVILKENPGIVLAILKEMALRLKITDENL